ncbi:MAG: hypothetical protein Q4G26_09870 [Paracoccus sp. (in: a-proteobacteria)]|nr:hypothetical protein [Paracoccus sp. (in: a-proteobacteria)]
MTRQLQRSEQKKIGAFLSFDGFARSQPGIYSFSGKVFSAEHGCLIGLTYDVDAADYTVALRRNDAALPDLKVTGRSGTCD